MLITYCMMFSLSLSISWTIPSRLTLDVFCSLVPFVPFLIAGTSTSRNIACRIRARELVIVSHGIPLLFLYLADFLFQ